jgi:hypothetical protein
MGRHQPLHPTVELGRLPRLNQQMEMIRHQAPGQNLHPKVAPPLEQKFDEYLIVTVLVKYPLPAVASIDQVVTALIHECPCNSWHSPSLQLDA